MGKKNFLEKNFIAGFIFFFFGGAMLLTTGMSRGAYPALIFILLVLFGAITMGSSIFKPAGSRIEATSKREVLFIASLFISPVLTGLVGFYVAGFLEIVTIMLIISPKRDKRTVLNILLFCAAAVVITYLIFTVGLRIRCPRGALLLI